MEKLSPYQIAIKRYLAIQMDSIAKWLSTYVEPMKILTDPEKLMGRPYETWTKEDHQRLRQIYSGKGNPYTRLMIKKISDQLDQEKIETGGF